MRRLSFLPHSYRGGFRFGRRFAGLWEWVDRNHVPSGKRLTSGRRRSGRRIKKPPRRNESSRRPHVNQSSMPHLPVFRPGFRMASIRDSRAASMRPASSAAPCHEIGQRNLGRLRFLQRPRFLSDVDFPCHGCSPPQAASNSPEKKAGDGAVLAAAANSNPDAAGIDTVKSFRGRMRRISAPFNARRKARAAANRRSEGM